MLKIERYKLKEIPKVCIIEEDKMCKNCCECFTCDLDPTKGCDNCARCLDLDESDIIINSGVSFSCAIE